MRQGQHVEKKMEAFYSKCQTRMDYKLSFLTCLGINKHASVSIKSLRWTRSPVAVPQLCLPDEQGNLFVVRSDARNHEIQLGLTSIGPLKVIVLLESAAPREESRELFPYHLHVIVFDFDSIGRQIQAKILHNVFHVRVNLDLGQFLLVMERRPHLRERLKIDPDIRSEVVRERMTTVVHRGFELRVLVHLSICCCHARGGIRGRGTEGVVQTTTTVQVLHICVLS